MEFKPVRTLADCYSVILNNPFIAAPVIAHFYRSVQGAGQNLLLAQLVLPLCFHPNYQVKISSAVFGNKRRSSIWSIFKNEERAEFCDLQERVDEWRDLSNLSLQHALNNDWIIFDHELLSVSSTTVMPPQNIATIQVKAAIKLGKLFSNLSNIEIFIHLGVIPK